jgi:hypothetical protein
MKFKHCGNYFEEVPLQVSFLHAHHVTARQSTLGGIGAFQPMVNTVVGAFVASTGVVLDLDTYRHFLFSPSGW